MTRFGFSNLDETKGSIFTSESDDLIRLMNLPLSDFNLDLVGELSVSAFGRVDASVLFWLL